MNLPRKELFHLPDGMIYLDGNSLGPLPRAVPERLASMLQDEWGELLITGWNKADWMAQPSRVGDRVGGLIGAPTGSVVLGDTLSVKVYQAVAAAIEMRPDRKVVLSDTGNFPTDLYMADGLLKTLKAGHVLKLAEPQDVMDAIDETVAAVMLTQVDYRTGRLHDMAAITEKVHSVGAVMIWDLAHSAGAVPVDLEGINTEFAIGCTYKYLNGGPGAPAFIYVRPDLIETVRPALAGWLGHEAPFAFDLDYRPGKGIERMRVGTPPVMQITALDTALDAWDGLGMDEIRAESIQLCETFISEVEQRCPTLTLASPRDPADRGSQVSFHFENGYPAMQAIIARGVIGDFRAPDIMRFGFTPLYIDESDVIEAAKIIEDVINNALWDLPEYKTKSRVT
ncbi:kynureninase [Thalassobium sp. R2A62]|jgi:kynureninase|uniref:kynureninase n=1 Tax=Thalassobium sp. R2A62 TaxID=633131 RepID=UPI0001B1CFC1|nr:kynureninase [Thalassobium sp. R2A62]EET47056.1 kynureninase [Thalassobium sp. R2A62]MDG1803312.1 kynureninase [Paracoccaceae bacterium]